VKEVSNMIAPISGNNYAYESSPGLQNPQQNFSTMLQQLQSGQLSAQTTSTSVLPQGGRPPQHVDTGSTPSSQPVHRHHHMHGSSQTDTDSDNTSASTLAQLGQPVQATTTSTAQQAYGSLQQDLQQVALNSDLLNAQASFLQDSALSVSA
jgi:hypothetical protein